MIKFNYGNCINYKNFTGGLKLKQILAYKSQEQTLKSNIFDKKTSHMLGWLDLPEQNNKSINQIKNFAKHVNANFKDFIVLGIGGSALGPIAVFNSLCSSLHNQLTNKKTANVYVCDNIDPTTFSELLQSVDPKTTMFNIVTKSGSTVETMTQMSIVVDFLSRKLKDKYTDNLVITTEEDNDLWNFAKEKNIETFVVPKDVGGRFSVLSPVGLLPIAVMGIDIKKLLIGATEMLNHSKEQPLEKNIPLLSAVINYLMTKSGKDEVVVMPYSSKLGKMSDFYLQLLSESLGKAVKTNGKKNTLTLTPIRAMGVTDQHSQIQLYEEGENNKFFCFMTQETFEQDIKVPVHPIEKFDKNMPRTMGQLLLTEQKATALALYQANRPSYNISIPQIDAENIGALLFYFEITTAFMGELWQVNTYNQPGVEQGKIYAKALLGNPDLKDTKQTLEELEKSFTNYEI